MSCIPNSHVWLLVFDKSFYISIMVAENSGLKFSGVLKKQVDRHHQVCI